jgi:hypothetical protein
MTQSAYTTELAAKFCAAVAEGDRSIRAICKQKGMPSKATVFRWLAENKEFQAMYEAAKDEQADTFVDEVVEIADQCKTTKSAVQKAKLQIYARIEAAQKMKPRKYGNRVQLTGEGGEPIKMQVKTMTDEELAAKIAEKMAKLGNDGA